MRPKIAVIGSSNIDFVAKVPKLPIPGETVIGSDLVIVPGGKGANQAVSIARLGSDVTFVTKLGMDDFGELAIKNFKNDGIDISFISRSQNAPSGTALIFVDNAGQNVLVAVPGANAELSVEDINRSRSVVENADVLVLQLEVPLDTVEYAVSVASENGIPIIMNPAPGRKLKPELIGKFSYLTPNETETEILTNIRVVDEASAKEAGLLLMGYGADNVVITMGKHGAMLISSDTCELIPGFEVKAVDATAAGDAFTGGLAYATATGKKLKDAVMFANAVAALTVTKMGAQPSLPYKKEVESFLGI